MRRGKEGEEEGRRGRKGKRGRGRGGGEGREEGRGGKGGEWKWKKGEHSGWTKQSEHNNFTYLDLVTFPSLW